MLLHGYTSCAEEWFSIGLAQRLVALGFYVVALDLRGHGGSARPTTAKGWVDDAEMRDIVTLADGLKLDTCEQLYLYRTRACIHCRCHRTARIL
eukprot:COSAG05_NODE_7278_length_834_cov_0.482993_1_plen_94_part_00